MVRKVICMVITLILGVFALSACAGKEAQVDASASIMYEGEAADSIEILYGTEESFSLSASFTGTTDQDEVQWSSDDAGVVRVKETSGSDCMFSILKTGSVKVTVNCGDASASIRIKILKNQDALSARDVALTVGEYQLSVEKVNTIMSIVYGQFVDYYGSYASYYGLDTSGGIAGLADQSCDYSEDGTWKGYFLEEAVAQIQQMYALKAYADENGIELDSDEQQEIQDMMEDFEEDAAEEGFDDPDKYAASIFGTGADEGIYEWYLELSTLASKAYDVYCDSLEYTDEEIKNHYIEMGYEDDGENDYNMASMRHILIMAEADENGEYSDEAIAAAHEKAEEIYQEWLAGDADEDSFAELANEYSEDSGSNTTGGLYEDIYKDEMVSAINDYLFGDRTYGDTAIIDNNGSYAGTHIVFFTGYGDVYSTYLSLSDLQTEAMDAWVEEITEQVNLEYGPAYDNAGSF